MSFDMLILFSRQFTSPPVIAILKLNNPLFKVLDGVLDNIMGWFSLKK